MGKDYLNIYSHKTQIKRMEFILKFNPYDILPITLAILSFWTLVTKELPRHISENPHWPHRVTQQGTLMNLIKLVNKVVEPLESILEKYKERNF